MNVLSLFDGMSCGRIALERANIKIDNYYASEIDQNAIKITQHNYPDTLQIGSVIDVNSSNISNIDLLIGGSPCQGFSSAGKGLNFDDPRSKLFFEYVRILKELKPKYFLLENVYMKQEWRDIISNELGVQPIDINSSLVSAGLRRRLYWTNIPNLTKIEDKNILLNSVLDNAYSDRDKSFCIDALYGKGSNLRRYLYRGSRQIVFTDKEFMNTIFKNKPTIEECNIIGNNNKDKWRFLTPEECEKINTIPVGYTNCVSKYNRYHAIGNGWTVDVISHILKGLVNDY